MNTYEAITTRYSCRNYNEEQITDDEIEKIVKAANAAPAASGNYSGLKITIIQNKELCQLIDKTASQNFPFPLEHPTYNAPTLVIISSKEDEHSPVIPYANASCIAENIMIEANEIGINSLFTMGIPMFIQDDNEVMEKINLPKDYKPRVVVALGHDKNQVQTIKEDRLEYEIIK